MIAEQAPAEVQPPSTRITNVRVFNGHELSELTAVTVSGATITDEPSAAYTVDGRGGTLLPGLIDAHVHLRDLEELRALACAGVTTALDMGSWPAELINGLRNQQGLPDVRSPGLPATTADSQHAIRMQLPDAALLGEPGQADRFVVDRIAEGADYIKVIADNPGPDQKLLDALVTAAHQHGRLCVVHAARLEQFRMAAASGADILTHVPIDQPTDVGLAASLGARGAIVVPTLVMMQTVARSVFGDQPGPERPGYHHARTSVQRLQAAGVPILVGTDANNSPGSPASVPHGSSIHREIALLSDAGIGAAEIIRAATSGAAVVFGLHDRGTIAVGKRADLLLVDGDPLHDLAALSTPVAVWCAGIRSRSSPDGDPREPNRPVGR